jgi:hypothetical protein
MHALPLQLRRIYKGRLMIITRLKGTAMIKQLKNLALQGRRVRSLSADRHFKVSPSSNKWNHCSYITPKQLAKLVRIDALLRVRTRVRIVRTLDDGQGWPTVLVARLLPPKSSS